VFGRDHPLVIICKHALDLLAYDSASTLVRKLGNAVIRPALKKHDELLMKKAEELRIRHVQDYPDDEESA
jgi:hypothetical protein